MCGARRCRAWVGLGRGRAKKTLRLAYCYLINVLISLIAYLPGLFGFQKVKGIVFTICSGRNELNQIRASRDLLSRYVNAVL